MSIPLPPLPAPASDVTAVRYVTGDTPSLYREGIATISGLASYSTDQLRARDQEIVRCVLEAAATKAENTICPCCYPDGSDAVAEDIAAAIRALEFHHE